MADLDNFKKINDTFGHLAGDNVLRESAKRLRNHSRTYDAIGRYGGEEFLMVLPGCDESGGLAQAERLRESIGSSAIQSCAGEIPVTCSVGMSWSARPQPSQTKELLRAADAALYRAKRAGRNRVEVHSAEIEMAKPQLAVSTLVSA
jgi:diguanylate cyclase (GGDEF)-like protein